MNTTDTFAVNAPAGTPEVIITRELDHPREKVFAAHVDAKAVAKWWGPRQYETVIETFEPHHGGTWRFIHRDAEGEYGFRGVYHEVTAPERIVYTFEFEGMPGHVLLETLTFEDLGDGRTKLTDSSVFQSIEDRDGMVATGMEHGARESMDRLDELLAAS